MKTSRSLLQAGLLFVWAVAKVVPPNPSSTIFEPAGDMGIQPDTGSSPAAAGGDFDGDGLPVLFVSVSGAPGRLYRNLGNGTFELLPDALPDQNTESHGCSWGDFDNDGLLDLFVAQRNGQVSTVYRNLGNLTFERLGQEALPSGGGNAVGAAWGDFNEDGLLDVFLTDLSGLNRLWRNTGLRTFQAVTDSPVVEAKTGVGCAWGDFDNDGDLDLFVANGGGLHNSLFRNDNGTFVKVTVGDLVQNGGYSVGCAWGDYDNDGDLDLFVAGMGGSAVRIYRNLGNGVFERVIDEPPAQLAGHGSAVVLADYTGNGFLDLFVARWAGGPANPSQLYRNVGNANHWLKIRLALGTMEPTVIGARVHILTSVNGVARWQRREIVAYDGWGGTSQEAHFGLGPSTVMAYVQVRWPSGRIPELRHVAANQALTIGAEPPRLVIDPPGGFFSEAG